MKREMERDGVMMTAVEIWQFMLQAMLLLFVFYNYIDGTPFKSFVMFDASSCQE